MSTLKSQIQDLERSLASVQSSADAKKDAYEKENLNAEIEAGCALVEKLVTENAELVEKVNELYMKLGSWDMGGDVASVAIPDNAMAEDPTSGPNEDISSSAEKAPKQSEKVPMELQYDTDMDHTNNMAQHSSEITVYGEIVQMTFDENEAQKQDPEAQCSSSTSEDSQGQGEGEGVPLTDAPLIGAPF